MARNRHGMAVLQRRGPFIELTQPFVRKNQLLTKVGWVARSDREASALANA